MIDNTTYPPRIAYPAGMKILECLGRRLDLLIIDVSMFEAATVDQRTPFSTACRKVKMLVITPRMKDSAGEPHQLRIPFTDQDLLQAANQVLASRQRGVVEFIARPKPPHDCRSDRRARLQAPGR